MAANLPGSRILPCLLSRSPGWSWLCRPAPNPAGRYSCHPEMFSGPSGLHAASEGPDKHWHWLDSFTDTNKNDRTFWQCCPPFQAPSAFSHRVVCRVAAVWHEWWPCPPWRFFHWKKSGLDYTQSTKSCWGVCSTSPSSFHFGLESPLDDNTAHCSQIFLYQAPRVLIVLGFML